jgi:hypothetical protein
MRSGTAVARPGSGLSERFWSAWNSAAAELQRPAIDFLRPGLEMTLKTLSTTMQTFRRNPPQLRV